MPARPYGSVRRMTEDRLASRVRAGRRVFGALRLITNLIGAVEGRERTPVCVP